MDGIRSIRAKSGTNLGGASAHNRRIMIDALRVNGALSRADLARATGLTPQAVSNIIEELARDGLVRSQASVRKGRGQRATPYRLVPEGAFAIGLQIDRHVTRTVIVNLVGDVLVKMEAKLPPGGPGARRCGYSRLDQEGARSADGTGARGRKTARRSRRCHAGAVWHQYALRRPMDDDGVAKLPAHGQDRRRTQRTHNESRSQPRRRCPA